MELARKKFYQGRRFSDSGEAELMEFHALVSKNFERAVVAFTASDRTLALEVLDQRPIIRQRERELRQSHIDRLRAGLTGVGGDLARSTWTSSRTSNASARTSRRWCIRDRRAVSRSARSTAGASAAPGGPLGRGRGARERLRILYVAAEVAPFAKTGGLADVAGRCRWRSRGSATTSGW